MRFMMLVLFTAATALSAPAFAADAHHRHVTHYRAVPASAPVYDAYGAGGARPEHFYGTSVPYDPDGPGYNDFQLQGVN